MLLKASVPLFESRGLPARTVVASRGVAEAVDVIAVSDGSFDVVCCVLVLRCVVVDVMDVVSLLWRWSVG